MFRFTIRELLILTVTAGLAVGWWMDRSLLDLALKESEHDRGLLEWVRSDLQKDIDRIGEQLPDHGLELRYFCGGRGTVYTVTKLDRQ